VGDATLPQIDGIAARAKDGGVWLALTNTDAKQAVDVNANVAGMSANSASGNVLTAPTVDSINTFDSSNSVTTSPVHFEANSGKLILRLPPKSVTVVRLDK
jgi:alpha-N-arabinofuranosidase